MSEKTFPEAVRLFVDSVLKAITDPDDAIKIFSALCLFPSPPAVTMSGIGAKQEQFYAGVSSLCRRMALTALARACSYYQPTSYDDAARLRTIVTTLIEKEIIIAGDSGEDASYQALSRLRTAVVQDLTSRGATLAPLAEYNFAKALPALALSYRLYQDVNRADQLIAFANPPHPAFMPIKFMALSQ